MILQTWNYNHYNKKIYISEDVYNVILATFRNRCFQIKYHKTGEWLAK